MGWPAETVVPRPDQTILTDTLDTTNTEKRQQLKSFIRRARKWGIASIEIAAGAERGPAHVHLRGRPHEVPLEGLPQGLERVSRYGAQAVLEQ